MIACEAGAQTHGPLFCAPDQRLEVAALNSSAKKGVDIDERSGEAEGAGGTPPFESHVVAFNGPLSSVSQAFVLCFAHSQATGSAVASLVSILVQFCAEVVA